MISSEKLFLSAVFSTNPHDLAQSISCQRLLAKKQFLNYLLEVIKHVFHIKNLNFCFLRDKNSCKRKEVTRVVNVIYMTSSLLSSKPCMPETKRTVFVRSSGQNSPRDETETRDPLIDPTARRRPGRSETRTH